MAVLNGAGAVTGLFVFFWGGSRGWGGAPSPVRDHWYKLVYRPAVEYIAKTGTVSFAQLHGSESTISSLILFVTIC